MSPMESLTESLMADPSDLEEVLEADALEEVDSSEELEVDALEELAVDTSEKIMMKMLVLAEKKML